MKKRYHWGIVSLLVLSAWMLSACEAEPTGLISSPSPLASFTPTVSSTSTPAQTLSSAQSTPVPTNKPSATKKETQAPTKKTTPAPTKKPATTSKPADVSATVYITDTGKKYHRSGCRYLESSKHAISLEKAKQNGYTPCSVCKP